MPLRRASCRGTIGGRDWRRPGLQRMYGNYFSTYLLRRIAGRAFEGTI